MSYFKLALAEGIPPSSRDGVNFRNAVLHAPAAFVGSTSHSQQLIEDILRLTPHPMLILTVLYLLWLSPSLAPSGLN